MPGYRGTRKPTYRRRTFKRKPRVQYIRPKTELKSHDQGYSNFVDFGGQVVNLGIIPVGSSYNQRDGISINPKNLTLRYHLLTNGGMTYRQSLFRLVIFRAKYENNIAIVPSDVLANVSTINAVISSKNWSKRNKTKILHDSCHALTRDTIGKGTMGKTGTITCKLSGAMKYDANTAAGTNIENGGLYALVISDIPALPANERPLFSFQARMSFTDS